LVALTLFTELKPLLESIFGEKLGPGALGDLTLGLQYFSFKIHLSPGYQKKLQYLVLGNYTKSLIHQQF